MLRWSWSYVRNIQESYCNFFGRYIDTIPIVLGSFLNLPTGIFVLLLPYLMLLSFW